jgi:hypothetical protein
VARRRAGQAKGGELIALTMAAALLFFVGVLAVRTSRESAASRARPEATHGAGRGVQDTARTPSVVLAGQARRSDSVTSRQSAAVTASPTVGAPKLDRSEVRRRIEAGAPGTYIVDMLADSDSMLTRWPERTIEPVRVWIQRTAPVPDWTPEIAQAARTAFDEWGEVGFPVRFTFTVDSTRADIRVRFTDRVTHSNQLGVTTHRHDADGWIVSADIAIATHDTAGAFLPLPFISGVARHEVGHALGLAHSKDRATIMYPESHTLAITGPDRATVKLLYMLPPGSVK